MVTAGQRTAVAYRRVSSGPQAKEDRSSLRTQTSHVGDWCQREAVSLIGSYTDVETGKRDDRKQYQKMLADVRQGGVDVIVVQFLDRFGRNPREILRRVWE